MVYGELIAKHGVVNWSRSVISVAK